MSILIIRGGAIGDFVLTLPAIHALKNHLPQAKVEIMGYPYIIELALKRFYADAIRRIDERSVAGFFARKGDLEPELSRYFVSFDLVVSYLYDPDQIFASNLKRVGVERLVIADGRPAQTHHATEHLARWLLEIGVNDPIEAPKLYPTREDQEEANRLFGLSQKPTVAVHMGSGSQVKNWPLERFVQLVDWLKNKKFQVLIMEGPADTEVRNLFWKETVSENCISCRSVTLPIVAAALQQCIAMVGHDSGISHIAAAVGVPTIAIFGPTNSKIWGPRGESVCVLQKGVTTSAVSLEDVKTALKPFLKLRDEKSS